MSGDNCDRLGKQQLVMREYNALTVVYKATRCRRMCAVKQSLEWNELVYALETPETKLLLTYIENSFLHS
jgi:hypothetical protein